ncbi:MAG: DUF6029 family protein [Bacteroidota bacterium]
MKLRLLLLISLSIFFFRQGVIAQANFNTGNVHGNFEVNAQLYSNDSVIEAPKVDEKMRMNAYLNLLYTNGGFTAGLRYEAYLNPMLGYDQAYEGNGIPYRFINYKKDDLEVTVGNFYEQFGNGLILRTYEDKTIGIDNSLDGIRLKFEPIKGIAIKGLVGNQRYYWTRTKGLVRGVDAEINFNDLIASFSGSKTHIIIGGSFVSKFQKDDPGSIYNLPQNVGASSARLDISRGKFRLSGEYADKINDPTVLNNWIYKNGQALLLQTSYSQKGLGISLSAKRIDNMNFRTDRAVTGSPLTLSYLPSLTKQQAYSLATIYPYATQPNGEMGFYGEILYKFKKGRKLGGHYGTDININLSEVNSLYKANPKDADTIGMPGTLGYQSDFFKVGDQVYFKEFNIEITHKFNKKFKSIFSYLNQVYNIDVIEGHPGDPMVYTNVAIADLTYMLNETNALHAEIQGLWTKQDKGNWAQLLLEYSIAPTWSLTLMDQYNYGNPEKSKQIHYFLGSFAYNKGTNRISVSWGRQRAGLLCVGGVCRSVPASNGFQINITSSF